MQQKNHSAGMKAIRLIYWTSMYSDDAAAIILERLALVEAVGGSCLTRPADGNRVKFLYCAAGSGTAEVRGEVYSFSSGNAVIFNAAEGFTIRVVSDRLLFYSFLMRGDLVLAAQQHLEKDRGIVVPAGKRVAEICESVCSLCAPGWSYEREVRLSGELYSLFTEIMLSTAEEGKVADIKCFIEEHYSEDISEQQLARSAYMSVSAMVKNFRRSYSMTPAQYLGKLRIDAAKRLLLNTDRPIMQIAADTGFSDASYFTRAFKRDEGITPREYRKNRFFLQSDV